MESEPPLKKKLRRGNTSDENDIRTDLSALHLRLSVNVNEDDIGSEAVNNQLNTNISVFRTSECSEREQNCMKSIICDGKEQDVTDATCYTNSAIATHENDALHHVISECVGAVIPINIIKKGVSSNAAENDYHHRDEMIIDISEENTDENLFMNLVKQCLCGIPDNVFQHTFEPGFQFGMLNEWPTLRIIQFLSSLQLLFDVYLKQNNNGHICSKIVSICNALIQNKHNLIEQIILLCERGDKYVSYLAAKVLSSFLISAKTNINNDWLEFIIGFLTFENTDYIKLNFALEIIKRVVEWKDVDIHMLEDPLNSEGAGSSAQDISICVKVPYSDSESYDTSGIKGLIIKSLETRWPELINKIQYLITQNSSMDVQTCVLAFLRLWESIISVKANLSVVDTKPFYSHLELFVGILNCNLSPLIWKQLLSLFNEVLCYGSTLALQDMLPEDTCQLAHLIVRYVKDSRLLDNLPYRRYEGYTVNCFVGAILSTQPMQSNIDKILLQKITLLVLKSVAITIKETRSDSSDSSMGSEDYDFSQDMQLIVRSIRDVLKKVETFIKASLEFHPETILSKVLIHLFSDQDDYMIESMVCTLDIVTGISYQSTLAPDFILMLNPVHSFIQFLKAVSYDSDVLLDYLVSNETCFLLYLLRFLKYTKRNWDSFIHSCYDDGISRTNELDNTMSVLIRLKMQIDRLVSKGLFPYNITPILRLLEICENFYEGNEFS